MHLGVLGLRERSSIISVKIRTITENWIRMENLMCSQDIQLHLNEFTGHTNVIDSVKDNTDTKSQSVMGALCDGWQAVIYRDC